MTKFIFKGDAENPLFVTLAALVGRNCGGGAISQICGARVTLSTSIHTRILSRYAPEATLTCFVGTLRLPDTRVIPEESDEFAYTLCVGADRNVDGADRLTKFRPTVE